MRYKLSLTAVLLVIASGARADDQAKTKAPDPAETSCADDPAAWAPGSGLESKKDGVVGRDFLALCRQKKKPRPGFPSGAPDDGLSGIVPADPVAQAKALRLQA
jgi:hypothetical protein